jgi:hypothetical protein
MTNSQGIFKKLLAALVSLHLLNLKSKNKKRELPSLSFLLLPYGFELIDGFLFAAEIFSESDK